MIALQEAPANKCAGCPRMYASGCTAADFYGVCPRGVRFEICPECSMRFPSHLLHAGRCQECRELQQDSIREDPHGDELDPPVDSTDRCPPRSP